MICRSGSRAIYFNIDSMIHFSYKIKEVKPCQNVLVKKYVRNFLMAQSDNAFLKSVKKTKYGE